MKQAAATESEVAPDSILRALKHGLGHEHVNDRNVDVLIRLAAERGETTIETLLREWRSPCGDDALPTAVPAGRAAATRT